MNHFAFSFGVNRKVVGVNSIHVIFFNLLVELTCQQLVGLFKIKCRHAPLFTGSHVLVMLLFLVPDLLSALLDFRLLCPI